jgi:hypothetical protein
MPRGVPSLWAFLPVLVACGGTAAPREGDTQPPSSDTSAAAPSRSHRLVDAERPTRAPDPTIAAAPDLPMSVACENDVGHPVDLYCTGLYARWPSLHLATDVREFDPGLHLWSDGADKQRYIWLPPGKLIDTTDMDEWTFPVGTKLWKEFSLGGHRIETRYLEKRDDGTWFRTTYVWSEDETRATELTMGATNVRGTTYGIPTQEQCTTCHKGRRDGVMGFEAIALSSPAATGVTMQKLVDAHLVTRAPTTPLEIPGSAGEQAALGWLHMNCGVACHNRSEASEAGFTGLHMRLTTDAIASVQATDTWNTAVGVVSYLQPVPNQLFYRIAPGNVSRSLIPYRDGNRSDPEIQMPPIATRLVDEAGLATVSAWISGM